MPPLNQLTRGLQTLAQMNPARCCLGRIPHSQAIVTCFTPLQQHNHHRLAAVQLNAWHTGVPSQSLGPCVTSSTRRCSSSSGGTTSRSSWSSSKPGTVATPKLVCHASGSASEQPGSSTLLTIPTMLTLARVAAIPALIAVWFWQDPASSAWVTGLFLAASITDWLDGYLARKMNASSAFGAFLDPVADKLMVATVLVLLSTQPLAAGPLAGNAWVMPVATLIIIGREITMSALREWAATMGPAAKAAVAVNAWGKWKTATQMAALTCLLFTRDGASSQLALAAAAAGPPLLGIAAYLTAHSLAIYLAGLWKFMK